MADESSLGQETSALHMACAEVDLRALHRWMGFRGLVDQDHALHCLLTECFGDLAPRPFRLRALRNAAVGVLYGYSRADADALRESAMCFDDPLHEEILQPSTLRSKRMPAGWREGLRLGFEVRVRPIVRLQRDVTRIPEERTRAFREGGLRLGKECDAFQWESLLHPQDGLPRTREAVYRDWLKERLTRDGGAELTEAALVAFRRARAVRKLRGRQSEGPDAVLRGILRITDSAAFSRLLAHGVGRHRAYGFGMLLLRPAVS